MRILGVEFDNLKEAFGYGFINGLGESGDGMGDMADAVRELKPAFEELGEQIGGAIRSPGTPAANVEAILRAAADFGSGTEGS